MSTLARATLLLTFVTLGNPTHAQEVGQAVKIRDVEDLIAEHWDPTQHLYVKGNLGIAQPQLSRLEAWLDEHGPNWTVVLLQQAGDERYQSLDHRTFRGMDAVEYALGRGLALRTNFSELVDARTGETNGAVFVLFLTEKKFSYYASEAQDLRGLGESRWVGELDRPAFRAMRGGGRIVDAVKGTVSNINDRLTRKIQQEAVQAEQKAAQAERERRARERAVSNLMTDIAESKQAIAKVTASATELKKTFPSANGELARPPVAEWIRQLDELAGNLTVENVAQSKKSFSLISLAVEGYLNAYAECETFDGAVAPIQDAIAGLRSHALSAGLAMAEQAEKLVNAAQAARDRGDRGLSIHLDKARQAVARGRAAIADEEALLVRNAARRRLMWQTILATVAVLALASVCLLAWLNRRRVPAKQRAHKAFADRDQSVKSIMDKVYGLLDRSGEILGSEKKVEQRGYTGETKKLADKTFEDIDHLLIMSNEVERVLDEARDLIHPKALTGKLTNMLSGTHYERGINRMSGEPLRFHRDQGLPLIMQLDAETSNAQPPDELTMTFDEIFSAFDNRTAAAGNALNLIEHSLLKVSDELRRLQEQIEQASSIDRVLSDAADDDGMFLLPAFFEELIPSAQSDFDEADKIAASDPVHAIQAQIPSGLRKITDALSIVEVIQQARDDIFPKLNQYAPQLQELEYNTNWIQQRVTQLGEQANRLIGEAVDRGIAADTDQFSRAVTGFGEQVAHAVELATWLKNESAPSLISLDQNIDDARKQISDTLDLSQQECLQEVDADPDAHLAQARKLMAAAQAALQRGGVDAASQARDALHEAATAGQTLVVNSLRVLKEFDSTLGERQTQLNAVHDKVPRHDQLIRLIRQDFAESSLVLQAGDPSYDDPTATVETHWRACRDSLDAARERINDGRERFRRGQLLAAAGMLDSADRHVREADQLLAEIDQHCTKLTDVSKENESLLVDVQQRASGLQSAINDRRTTRPTIERYCRLLDRIEVAQREIRHAPPRDPFQDRAVIDGFAEAVAVLNSQIEADADAYAEAKRAVDGATEEQRIGKRLIDRSRRDGIPDSPATTQSVNAIQRISSSLERAVYQLKVEHNDWNAVDQEGSRIHSELGVETARLRGELDRARRSVDTFQAASNAVFEASRWTGGLGIRIFGSPGSSELQRAREALNQGNYGMMNELARAAQIAAQQAVQRAQREVYRKQREAARQAEAARRRRRQASTSFSSGSSMSSLGGGSSGGGISSHHSSSGGSSPSGSGFSRSGW